MLQIKIQKKGYRQQFLDATSDLCSKQSGCSVKGINIVTTVTKQVEDNKKNFKYFWFNW